jgi:PPOX class probable F420-dependent enzyme
MASRRELIRMSDEEVDEFLHGRRSMSVATLMADGRPHVVAMWYGFHEGKPAFETFAKSQKVLNLRRDPRITCLVEDGDVYEELRGVELVGSARVEDDTDVLRAVATDVVRRYHDLDGEAAEMAVEMLMRKRVAVVIDIERVVSWDHRKLAGTY